MAAAIDTDLKQRFFEGMSHAACTVNVVTTDGPGGRAGVTVSAMASVSADTPKPSLLVCVHHLSPAAAAILANGTFCVNVLRDDQAAISDTFAGRMPPADGDKFSCATWTTQVTGAPRVSDPLVAFDCRLMSSEQVGTHWVLFGAVEDIFVAADGSPLIYANRAYGTSVPIAPAAPAPVADDEHETLRLGCFRTFGPYIVPRLLSGLLQTHPSARVHLREDDPERILESLRAGETDVALLYDFELGPSLEVTPLVEIAPYVLLPRDHPLARRPRLQIADLAGEPFVLLDAPTSREYFLSIFDAAGIEPRVRLRSPSFEMVRALVGNGLGFSLLATKPASNMSYDGRALVTLPLQTDVAGSRVVLVTHEGAEPTPIARDFAEQCRHFFQAAAA